MSPNKGLGTHQQSFGGLEQGRVGGAQWHFLSQEKGTGVAAAVLREWGFKVGVTGGPSEGWE